MNTKVCKKCNKKKIIDEFGKLKNAKDGYNNYCKTCLNLSQQLYRNKNRIHTRKLDTERKRLLREENPKKYEDYNKFYYQENRVDEIKRSTEYQNNNKEKVKIRRNIRHKIRYNNDVIYKIKCTVRNRLKKFLKIKTINRKTKTFDIIGCDSEFLKKHIENHFTDGMTWNNYGLKGWHIDHKIPLDSVKTEDDVYKLCHYTNLQPLWWKDNIEKGNKIEWKN